MATLDSFLSRLMVWVPSCPRPLADQALRDAAANFCRDTEIVQRTLVLDAQFNVRDYTPTLPSGTKIARVLEAQYRGRPLSGAGEVPTDGAIGVPLSVSSPTSSTLRLYPAPDETETSVFTVRVALEPLRSANTVPDELFDEWAEAIVAGAGAYITSIPDQSFTNPTAAVLLAGTYAAKLSEARAEAGRARVKTSPRVRSQRFA